MATDTTIRLIVRGIKTSFGVVNIWHVFVPIGSYIVLTERNVAFLFLRL
jgi:hypothetical protein